MSTYRENPEARHRWSTPERKRLIERSRELSAARRDFVTVGDAADALYVEFGQPRSSVYAQLYAMFTKGRCPWLTLSVQRERDGFSPSFNAAVRELVRVMRIESLTDIMISLGNGRATIETVHRTKSSTTIEVE